MQKLADSEMVDAHIHLDRAWTAEDRYWSHAGLSVEQILGSPLEMKQYAMGELHNGLAYEPNELESRMRSVLNKKLEMGEVEVWGVVDTSPDIDDKAFRAAMRLREEFEPRGMKLKVAAYPIHGLKEPRSDRIKLLEEISKEADFLVALPERDARQGHERIGFNGHLKYMIELACKRRIPLQVHLDQMNAPEENGTESLIEAVRWLGSPKIPGYDWPTIEAVHVISPSCYDEARFQAIVEGLRQNNIGVLVCPHAAISMRQLRPCIAPVHNCIARVRELLAAGIKVRLGTDNVGDIFVSLPNPSLTREIEMICSAVRFYDFAIWNKIAQMKPLNNVDIAKLRSSLNEDEEVFLAHRR